MSSANINLVQDIYAAFGRRDIPAMLEKLAPDATWGMVGRPEDVPMAGIRSGKAGAIEFFRILAETQDITSFEPQRFVGGENMVFAFGRIKWIMRRNGVAGENEFLHVFTIRDGMVCAWRGYQDTGSLAEAYHRATAAKRAAAE